MSCQCRTKFCYCILVWLAAVSPRLQAQVYCEQIKSFGFAEKSASNPGSCQLVEGSDGLIYGTTDQGGQFGTGTIFAFDRITHVSTVLFSFKPGSSGDGEGPDTGVVADNEGVLYGTTSAGGPDNAGVIFRIDESGANFELLHNFGNTTSDLKWPLTCPLLLPDENILGTCAGGGNNGQGGVFKSSKNGSGYTVIKAFGDLSEDGVNPEGTLILASDGYIYGTTSSGGQDNQGTIYRLKEDGSDYSIVFSFSSTMKGGIFPKSGLLQLDDGFLYGTTLIGGEYNMGTVFKIRHGGTEYTTVHDFVLGSGVQPQAAPILGSDGFLYGTTANGSGQDSVYRLSTDGTTASTLHLFVAPYSEGKLPHATLLEADDGNLYGTTAWGGIGNEGTLYRINKDTANFESLMKFQSDGGDGRSPVDKLTLADDGTLYGAAGAGGDFDLGIVFRMQADGSSYKILRHFEEGSLEYSPILGSDNQLYGTLRTGGQFGGGAIYRMSVEGTNFEVIQSMGQNITDATSPGKLLQGTDGFLYGTSVDGGYLNRGTLFRIAKDGSEFTIVKRFGATDTDGRDPTTSLVEGKNGYLYGTTASGGNLQFGTLFKIAKSGSEYSVLHSFSGGVGGSKPNSTLLLGPTGEILGTTWLGGNHDAGTIFRISDTGDFSVLYDFSNEPSAIYGPLGGLILDDQNRILGAAGLGGAENAGGLFSFEDKEANFQVLHIFEPSNFDGAHPLGSFVKTKDGWIIGISDGGGAMGGGTVFRFRPAPVATTDHFDRLQGSPLEIPINELTANDFVHDFSQIQFEDFSPVSSLGAQISRLGESLYYSPGSGLVDSDSFTYVIRSASGAFSTGIVEIAVFDSPNVDAPSLISLSPTANGSGSVYLDGVTNRAYNIQYCNDLSLLEWRFLSTVRADANGKIKFIDAGSAGLASRFYQAVAQ